MDAVWAAGQLIEFAERIDRLSLQMQADPWETIDWLIRVDPVMKDLMNAVGPGHGDYRIPDRVNGSIYEITYWTRDVKPWVLRAIEVPTRGAEAKERMKPDSPDLVADQLHPWVWQAAAALRFARSRQEAVHAAARSENARLQQRLSRYETSETCLRLEAFSLDAPAAGRQHLRFPGDRTSDTWRSRQQGGMHVGAGCFSGIRNPAAHEDGLVLTEQVALEQLAAFSLLARWIDECTVETAPG